MSRSVSPLQLIAIDWGTTSCRLAGFDAAGAIIARVSHGPGILAVPQGGFPAALDTLLAQVSAAPDVPVILSGMVGSRQGWIEAPYVQCPAGLAELSRGMIDIQRPGAGPCAIIPGMTIDADWPDVMRGEETQVIGVLSMTAGLDDRLVLPGTHSKWLEVRAGRIHAFASYMTGEVFATLRTHTILARMLAPTTEGFDGAAFARGVAVGAAAGGPGALLNRIFSTRTLALFDRLEAAAGADYLSGILIGAEIAESTGSRDAAAVTIVGSDALSRRYAAAFDALDRAYVIAAPDAAAHGARAVAKSAGWL